MNENITTSIVDTCYDFHLFRPAYNRKMVQFSTVVTLLPISWKMAHVVHVVTYIVSNTYIASIIDVFICVGVVPLSIGLSILIVDACVEPSE